MCRLSKVPVWIIISVLILLNSNAKNQNAIIHRVFLKFRCASYLFFVFMVVKDYIYVLPEYQVVLFPAKLKE